MIRAASPDEGRSIARFFEGFEPGLSVALFDGMEPAVVQREGEEAVVLVSPDILSLDPALWHDADHAGLRIGTLEEGRFAMDLQGAVRMAQHTRKQVVRVTEQATRLFLYGRDVFGSSVKSFDPRLDPGDICIVVNLRWEAIGLGEVMGRFKGDVPAVRPVHDLGTYLRDQDQ